MRKRTLLVFSLFSILASQIPVFSQAFNLLRDINPGIEEKQPVNLTEVNGTLLFVLRQTHLLGYPSDPGSELWKSDGTDAGTVQLKGLTSIPYLTNANGTIYFANLTGTGDELWKSDGTQAGTVLVKTLPGDILSAPCYVNGLVFFTLSGNELWKSDGTDAGTQLVKTGVQANNLTNVNGSLFFSAVVGSPFRNTLWKSDGTEAGTVIVKDAFPGTDRGDLSNFSAINGVLYFIGNDGINGAELWKSDGRTWDDNGKRYQSGN